MTKPKRTELTSDQLAMAANLRHLIAMRTADKTVQKKEIAELAGMKPTTLSQYAAGTIALNVEAVLRLSRALDAHPVEIDPNIVDLLPVETSDPCDKAKLEQAFRLAYNIMMMPSDQRTTLTSLANSLAKQHQSLPPPP